MENKIAGETDDELFELDWEMRKKTQTRRCSVFSKSFDPNSSKSSKTEVTDYAENSYEIVKNKPFELNQTPYGTKYSEYNGTGFFGELSLLYDQV